MNEPKLRFKKDDGSEFPEWEEKRLKEICDIVGGGTPSTDHSEYWNGDIQWFTPTEVGHSKYVAYSKRTITKMGLSKSNAKLLPVGTILLTTRATLGEMSIAATECCTNQGFQSLIVKPEFSRDYVYYLQDTIKAYCKKHAAGSTFLEISSKQLGKCNVLVSCIEEQQKIAACLSAIDYVIEQTQSEIYAWEKQKRGVMQLLFSRKVRFKADDGSEFPEWEEKALGDIVAYEHPNKYIVSSTEYANSGVPVLTAGKTFILGYTSEDYGIKNATTEKPVIIFDDFMTTSHLVTFNFKVKSSAMKLLTGIDGLSDTVFISSLVEGLQFNPQDHSRKWISIFMPMPVSVPSLAEQQKIAACLSGFDDVIDKAKKELEAYRELKKGLLQQMFV